MSAQEMVAWQTVIRVMAHEVMNSLTPVSSLSATAHELVAYLVTRNVRHLRGGQLKFPHISVVTPAQLLKERA